MKIISDKQMSTFHQEYAKYDKPNLWRRFTLTPRGIEIEYGHIHSNGMHERVAGRIMIDNQGNVSEHYPL